MTQCKSVGALLLMVAVAASAMVQASAIEEFQKLRTELRQSHAKNDWRSNLTSAEKLKAFLNQAPDSLLEVARASTHVGDLNAAFRSLEQFVDMGQSSEVLETLPDFTPLRQRREFKNIQDRMKANQSPISRASTVFSLPDSNLLAEDLDFDPNTRRFFITSVREKKIVSVDGSGKMADFAKSPDNWSMLAIKVDSSRGVVWATEVAMQGFIFAPESDWGRSAVLSYDIRNGTLLGRVEGPRGSALGDMVLTPDGGIIVSDGEGGGVYHLLPKHTELERLDGGEFISPQTPALHPDGKHVFVPDYVRGIGVLEIATKQVQWLSMEGRFALNGIDGLYFDHGLLIAVQNGTSPERVVTFRMDPALTKIQSETIIERSTETLGDPTHGVIVGKDFYYIANSGWDVIDEHGNMKAGSRQSAPRIMRARLRTRIPACRRGCCTPALSQPKPGEESRQDQ